MTDREILNDVSSKLDALEVRVAACESASEGSVSHAEVKAVVDAENNLEERISMLEAKYQPTVPETPVVEKSDSVGLDNNVVDFETPTSHVIT